MNKAAGIEQAFEMRQRPPQEGMPDIAILKYPSRYSNEVPIIPDSVVYFGSGAAVIMVFAGLCIMAYMLIFSEGTRDTEGKMQYKSPGTATCKVAAVEVPCQQGRAWCLYSVTG
ncbi:uncharacterized protein ISCGN_030723 [Ixodes scapularis]